MVNERIERIRRKKIQLQSVIPNQAITKLGESWKEKKREAYIAGRLRFRWDFFECQFMIQWQKNKNYTINCESLLNEFNCDVSFKGFLIRRFFVVDVEVPISNRSTNFLYLWCLSEFKIENPQAIQKVGNDIKKATHLIKWSHCEWNHFVFHAKILCEGALWLSLQPNRCENDSIGSVPIV